MITKAVANKLRKQMAGLDVLGKEAERLYTETIDGHRLHVGLEVYSGDDPSYLAVIVNPKKHMNMSTIRVRQKSDRRKKATRDQYDAYLFVDQSLAFAHAIKEHDKISFMMIMGHRKALKKTVEHYVFDNNCHRDVIIVGGREALDNAVAMHDEKRLELYDQWAMMINKKNPRGALLRMESKKYKRKGIYGN